MNVLIFGANGFIGSHLSEAILAQNRLAYLCDGFNAR